MTTATASSMANLTVYWKKPLLCSEISGDTDNPNRWVWRHHSRFNCTSLASNQKVWTFKILLLTYKWTLQNWWIDLADLAGTMTIYSLFHKSNADCAFINLQFIRSFIHLHFKFTYYSCNIPSHLLATWTWFSTELISICPLGFHNSPLFQFSYILHLFL